MKTRVAWKIAGNRWRSSQPQRDRSEVLIRRLCVRAARKAYGRPVPFDWGACRPFLEERGDV